MKQILIISLLLTLANSSSLLAQSIEFKKEISNNSELHFFPDSSSVLATPQLNFYFKNSSKKNSFLSVTGYLLQGLKFGSAVDQFNATAPFDIRGYKPASFSSYTHTISQNYLLAQPIQPIK